MSNDEARSFLESIGTYLGSRDSSSGGAGTNGVRLATIDPAYTTGLAKVIYDGETQVNAKGYAWASGYSPVANDRVFLIPAGSSFIIGGKILTSTPAPTYSPWLNHALHNGWTYYVGGGGYNTTTFRMRREGSHFQLVGMIKNTGSGSEGSTICTVHTSYRHLLPVNSTITPAIGPGGATCGILIDTLTGTIKYYSGPTNPSFISINFSIPWDN